VTLSVLVRRRTDVRSGVRTPKPSSDEGLENGTRLAAGSGMSDPRRLRRLFGAAAQLCQVEVDLAAAGYPELVAKLEDIRAVIDLEIACLEPDDLSQPHCG
jgi:hypothetical protein